MSHRWIHEIITEIGRNHDEELLQFVQHLESVLQTEQVIFGTLYSKVALAKLKKIIISLNFFRCPMKINNWTKSNLEVAE